MLIEEKTAACICNLLIPATVWKDGSKYKFTATKVTGNYFVFLLQIAFSQHSNFMDLVQFFVTFFRYFSFKAIK